MRGCLQEWSLNPMIANHWFDFRYDCVDWNSFAYLTLINDWDNNKVSLFWELFFGDRLIKGIKGHM